MKCIRTSICLISFLILNIFGQESAQDDSPGIEAKQIVEVPQLQADNSERVLRMNEIQTMGTHNSFKLPVPPRVAELLQDIDKITHNTDYHGELTYGMPPIEEQLSAGARHFELDLAYDPTGSLYGDPAGLRLPDLGILADIIHTGRHVVEKVKDGIVHAANKVGVFFSGLFGRSMPIQVCPETHPYAYLSGASCCASKRERIGTGEGPTCDGGALRYPSSCCWNDDYVPCPFDNCEDSTTSTPGDNAIGWKVMHMPDIDFESHCTTLVGCLKIFKKWSDTHPRHLPMALLLNIANNDLKEGIEAKLTSPVYDFLSSINVLPFTEVPDVTRPLLLSMEEEILSVFGKERIISPDEVRGDKATLEEAILSGTGWPTVADSLGKVFFVLDSDTPVTEAYLTGNENLEERVMFVTTYPGSKTAATLVMNDPYDSSIDEFVRKGYYVRTRSDIRPVPEDAYERADAAMRSGAQLVSTDFIRMKDIAEGRTAEEYSTEPLAENHPHAKASPKPQPQMYGYSYYYSVTHIHDGYIHAYSVQGKGVGVVQSRRSARGESEVVHGVRRQAEAPPPVNDLESYSVRFDPTCNPLLVEGPCPLFQDGGWSKWSDWGDCTCDYFPDGKLQDRKRTRTCTAPKALNGGLECTGVDQEYEDCGIPCPSASPSAPPPPPPVLITSAETEADANANRGDLDSTEEMESDSNLGLIIGVAVVSVLLCLCCLLVLALLFLRRRKQKRQAENEKEDNRSEPPSYIAATTSSGALKLHAGIIKDVETPIPVDSSGQLMSTAVKGRVPPPDPFYTDMERKIQDVQDSMPGIDAAQVVVTKPKALGRIQSTHGTVPAGANTIYMDLNDSSDISETEPARVLERDVKLITAPVSTSSMTEVALNISESSEGGDEVTDAPTQEDGDISDAENNAMRRPSEHSVLTSGSVDSAAVEETSTCVDC